jgi:uncharacterized protein RhaS with RHS repeats
MNYNPLIAALVIVLSTLTLNRTASAYYDPALGRFIAREHGGYLDGKNLYHYGRNRPMNFVDPTGWQTSQPTTGPASKPSCNLQLRCGKTASGTQHCGVVISDEDGTIAVDGSGGDVNQMNIEDPVAPWGSTGPGCAQDGEKCECLRASIQK